MREERREGRTDGNVVVRVPDGAEDLAVSRGRPGPRPGPARALNEDELAGRTRGADTVHTGLHEIEDRLRGDVVRLVLEVEDDVVVRFL